MCSPTVLGSVGKPFGFGLEQLNLIIDSIVALENYLPDARVASALIAHPWPNDETIQWVILTLEQSGLEFPESRLKEWLVESDDVQRKVTFNFLREREFWSYELVAAEYAEHSNPEVADAAGKYLESLRKGR